MGREGSPPPPPPVQETVTSASRAWASARSLPESTVRWIATAAVSLPIVVAVIALAGRDWYPVLDMAMTELRVRDVGTSHTPLIGLPGRIGDLPEQGSHPGPLSFYLLAPVYRLLGSSAIGLEVGMGVLAIVAVTLALWIAQRRGGRQMILVVAGVLVLMIRGYGVSVPEIDGNVVVQPWNPYLPLLFWVVVLLAVWSVLAGDRSMLVVVVAAGSLCAQTHIPYLGLVVGMLVLCVVWTIVEWSRHSLLRNELVRTWRLSAVVGVVLWIPVLIDQLTETPGNVSALREHFSSPQEAVVGFGEGFALMLRHLDVFRLASGALDGDGYFVRAGFDLDGPVGGGLIVLLVWLGTIAIAVSLRASRLIALHATVAMSLVLGWISMSRIFGKVWFYLTLWSWATTVLMVVAVGWTAIAFARGTDERKPAQGRSVPAALGALGAMAAIVSLVVVTVEAADARPPEQGLSDTLGALVGPTEEAIRLGAGAADGAGGRYLVTFDDASTFGSQAFGLVSELERRGLDVGMDEYWHVPITSHRVMPRGLATAQVHLATGAFVAEWQARPDAHQAVLVEPRDEDELARYADLEAELGARLDAAGLDDLVPLITRNLFGLQLDERVEPDLQSIVNEMLRLGQPTAVFIIPVDADR